MAAHRIRRRHDPVNPETVVEVVSKTIKPDDERRESSGAVAHITLEELERALENRINRFDVETIARETIARMQGRV
jgi:hypothetical protein